MTAVLVAACLVGAALVLVAMPAGAPRWVPASAARWRPSTLLAQAVGCAGAGGVAAAMGGPVAAVLTVGAMAAIAHHVRTARSAKVAAAGRAAEMEALAALAGELRSGRQPAAALAAVRAPGALGAALAAAGRAAPSGGDVPAALRRAGPQSGALDRLAAAWQLSELTGVPLAAVVGRVEADARAAGGLRERAWAELAGARATGGLLAGLPLLGVGLGQAMGAHPVHVLLHTPLGALCCGGGLAFEAAGLAWISRLTRGAVEP